MTAIYWWCPDDSCSNSLGVDVDILSICPVKLPAYTIRGASPAVWRWFEAFTFVSCFILVAISSCVVSHFLLPVFVCSVSQHQSCVSSFSQCFFPVCTFLLYFLTLLLRFFCCLLSCFLHCWLLEYVLLEFGLWTSEEKWKKSRKWGGIPLCNTQDYTVNSRRTLQNLSKLLKNANVVLLGAAPLAVFLLAVCWHVH